MTLKGILFNTLCIVLIASFILIDLMLMGILRFEEVQGEQKVSISSRNEIFDNDVILQNKEV
jgi:hypothetical protein